MSFHGSMLKTIQNFLCLTLRKTFVWSEDTGAMFAITSRLIFPELPSEKVVKMKITL